MRIELIDRIMFPVMSKVCIKELQKDHPEWNGRAIKQNARRRFIKMLKETPSIGRLSQNHWKFNLVGGAVWFALYEAVEELYGRMSNDLYSRMCNACMTMPIMAKRYASTPFFSEKYQDNYIKKVERVNRIKSEYNWNTIIEKGRPRTPCGSALPPAVSAPWQRGPVTGTSFPLCAPRTTPLPTRWA